MTQAMVAYSPAYKDLGIGTPAADLTAPPRGNTWSFQWVMRTDPYESLFRFFRIKWERGAEDDRHGYSAILSVGLRPSLFRFRREDEEVGQFSDVSLFLAFVRVRYSRSTG